MVTINNLKELKKYQHEKYNTLYYIKDENGYLDVEINCQLPVDIKIKCKNFIGKYSRIDAKFISAENIDAKDLYVHEINCEGTINANFIKAYMVNANVINANDVDIDRLHAKLNLSSTSTYGQSVTINNLDELKKYYNNEYNSYEIINDKQEYIDAKITFDLDIDADLFCRNLDSYDINVHEHDIEATNIDAGDITAHSIRARNIDALKIEAYEIRCDNYIYAGTIIADYVEAQHTVTNREEIGSIRGSLSVNGGE